jgi:hypothetical protein
MNTNFSGSFETSNVFVNALHKCFNILYFPTFEPPFLRVKVGQLVNKFITSLYIFNFNYFNN